jgi:hypothetical protein
MRKARFKGSIGSTAACRYRQGEQRSTGSSITGTGLLSLYAALNPQTGEVLGQTATRHTSHEFVAFGGFRGPADRAGSACHPGQLCHSQNGLGEGLPAAAPQCEFARQPTCPDPALYPALLENSQTLSLENTPMSANGFRRGSDSSGTTQTSSKPACQGARRQLKVSSGGRNHRQPMRCNQRRSATGRGRPPDKDCRRADGEFGG